MENSKDFKEIVAIALGGLVVDVETMMLATMPLIIFCSLSCNHDVRKD